MLYLAWDIDGTLLLTNRAGYDALQEAICDYFFRKEPYQFKHTLAGCTVSTHCGPKTLGVLFIEK